MRDPIENISHLQTQLNDLQLENQILKNILDNAGISYGQELLRLHAVELSELMENGKYHICAQMQIWDSNQQCEKKAIKDGRYISQRHIAGKEGKILSDIASDTIYLRHLPDSYEAGRHIDAARFVMITAAFEWEFRRIFPEGVKKKASKIEAEKQARQILQGLMKVLENLEVYINTCKKILVLVH